MKYQTVQVAKLRIALLAGATCVGLLGASPAFAQATATQGVGADGFEVEPDYVETDTLIDVDIPPLPFDLSKIDLSKFDPLDITTWKAAIDQINALAGQIKSVKLPTFTFNNLTCAQQLDVAKLTADGIGQGIELTGIGLEILTALDPSGVTEALAVGGQLAGYLTRSVSYGLDVTSATLPNCNSDFIGGIKVISGGFDVTGDSVVRDSLGVGANLSVGGDIYANDIYADAIYATTVDASGAISAYGGLITLGNVDRNGVQPGISIGGGAIAGAGHLGPESNSLHRTSIAIGNASWATSEGSVAYGTNANSDGFGTVAVGYDSSATAAQAVAIGNRAQASGANSIAIGNQAVAKDGAAVAIGFLNTASGNGAVAIGDPNLATGRGAVAIGADNIANGIAALAIGADSAATGNAALALGAGSVATGDGAQATGLGARATGLSAIASGTGASAVGNGTVAIGQGANASQDNAVAIGAGASATFADSVAIGVGAVTTRPGEIAIGSAQTIISMPVLTSAASREAQIGQLSLVTTDRFGTLSSDGGTLAAASLVNRQGVALGIAMQNPDLTGNENGGVAFNWGQFEGASAFSLAGSLVLARNVFGDDKAGRLTISGSLGIATNVTDEVYRIRQGSTVATRVGGQITF